MKLLKAEKIVFTCVKYLAFVGVGLTIAAVLKYGFSWYAVLSFALCIAIWLLSLKAICLVKRIMRDRQEVQEELELDAQDALELEVAKHSKAAALAE